MSSLGSHGRAPLACVSKSIGVLSPFRPPQPLPDEASVELFAIHECERGNLISKILFLDCSFRARLEHLQ
jgi:hypothetical protein